MNPPASTVAGWAQRDDKEVAVALGHPDAFSGVVQFNGLFPAVGTGKISHSVHVGLF